MNLRWIFSRAAAMSLALCMAACGHGTNNSADAASGAVDGASQKVYVVGSDASYAPFEYTNDHQAVVGFDVDVLTAIAAKSGFKVKFVNTPWEGIFSTLIQGHRDILASSITITPERMRSMDFSDSYFVGRQLMAVAKTQEDVRSFRDLKNKRVAVQVGTTADSLVQKLQGVNSANLKRFETMPQAMTALTLGEVDAAVGDNGEVSNFVHAHAQSGIYTIEDSASFAPERYGFAVKKGNQALLDKINSGLAALRVDGTYDAIYKKYFGESK